ncbi:MAG: HAMP domain-containing protein, partial [Eubacteriales bacterium]|nr:HAMP domain-containing protein [Eubacteriales bacterium]
MKRSGLFLRMFWAFVAVMLVTASVLSSMMVVMVRGERAAALENARLSQARDVARLMQQYNITLNSFWPSDSSVSDILRWKIGEIRSTGDADVWLVAPNRRVLVLGSNAYDQALSDEEVVRQVGKVLSGEEIRVQGLIRELGGHMVTIGVPWRDARGRVDGAVLLHISTESLSVDYSDLIRNAAIAAAVAMALGALLAFVIARRQTEPIRQIRLAVKDFSEGRLERRVMVRADEELMELAGAFNRMAEDLSQLEDSRRSFVANVS